MEGEGGRDGGRGGREMEGEGGREMEGEGGRERSQGIVVHKRLRYMCQISYLQGTVANVFQGYGQREWPVRQIPNNQASDNTHIFPGNQTLLSPRERLEETNSK